MPKNKQKTAFIALLTIIFVAVGVLVVLPKVFNTNLQAIANRIGLTKITKIIGGQNREAQNDKSQKSVALKTLTAKVGGQDIEFIATANSARVKMWVVGGSTSQTEQTQQTQGIEKSQETKQAQPILFIEPMFKPTLEKKSDQDGDKYIFTDTSTQKQFVYSIVDDTLKQDIIITNPPIGSANIVNPAPVQVVAPGLSVDINSAGEAVFTDGAGKMQFVLKAPWAKDAVGNEIKNLSYRYNGTRLVRDDLNLYTGGNSRGDGKDGERDVKAKSLLDSMVEAHEFSLVLDTAWLTSKDRVFPITIDPTIASIGNPAGASQQSKYCPPQNQETNCADGLQPAPKAQYDFDDATGTTVTDVTGNAYTGTFSGSGTHWYSQGKINFAGSFNGTDDFVDVGSGPTGVKSVGFWVYPASTTEYFIDLNGSAYIWANAGTLTATGFTSPTIYVNGVKSTTITANTWQYVMVTTETGVDATDLDLGRLEGTDYFEGKLDQVRLYDYVRTPAQTAWDFSLGAPVAWYKFNENTGTTIGDWGASGNGFAGNTLTLTIGAGGAYTTSADAWGGGNPGKIHTSLGLDGTDDYATTNNVALLASNGTTYTNVSWGAWVKPTNAVTRTIIHKDNEFRLRLTSAGYPTCEVYTGGAWQSGASSPYVLPLTSWSHILCTYDGANIKIYVNGVFKNNQSHTASITSTNATALNIGRDSGGSEYFYGVVDEARIYSYALSANQVKTAKNDGIVAYGREPVTAELPQTSICGSFSIAHVASGGVAPVDKVVSYGSTLTGIGGTGYMCWITQNLGATNQASSVSDNTEASAGWYWQFNRIQGFKHDGTTRTPSTAWDSTNDNTYTGWDPAKDPCTLELGAGWRLPTYTEYYNMDNTGGWTTWAGPWDSALKLHAAGRLDYSTGALIYRGSNGSYWSSDQFSSAIGYGFFFYSIDSYINRYNKSYAFSVRCFRTP